MQRHLAFLYFLCLAGDARNSYFTPAGVISLTLNVLCNWHLRDTEAQFQLQNCMMGLHGDVMFIISIAITSNQLYIR